MSDSFDREVASIRKSKTKAEIQRDLANSSVGQLAYQYRFAALQQIEAEEAAESRAETERRHVEEMTAAAVSNRIGLTALRRSNLSLILSGVAILAAIGIAIWQHYCK